MTTVLLTYLLTSCTCTGAKASQALTCPHNTVQCHTQHCNTFHALQAMLLGNRDAVGLGKGNQIVERQGGRGVDCRVDWEDVESRGVGLGDWYLLEYALKDSTGAGCVGGGVKGITVRSVGEGSVFVTVC